MKRTSMVLLILFLIIGGYTCGCSNDKPGVESKVKEAVKSSEDNVVGEAEKLEKDYRVLEAENDYKKALKEEPKAPPEAMEGADGKMVSGEGLASPPE